MEERKKGGEDEGRKVTRSGWDRAAAAVDPPLTLYMICGLSPRTCEHEHTGVFETDGE